MGRPCQCCKPAINECDETSFSGGAGLTINAVGMPTFAGTLLFRYNAYYLVDRFWVYYKVGSEDVILFDTGAPISGSGEVQIFKPLGVTTVYVKVQGVDPGTAWQYYLSCPEPLEIDSRKYCGDGNIFGTTTGSSDEKTGPIPLADGLNFASEEECEKLKNPNSLAPIPPPAGVGRGGGVPAPLPSSGPNSGGFFPRYSPGPNGTSCGATTHTNINQPRCYNLQLSGSYISSDPDVFFYYYSSEYPEEAGRVILNFGNGLSQNPEETPIRNIEIWTADALGRLNRQLTTLRLDRSTANVNWCTTLEKPLGVKSLIVLVSEIRGQAGNPPLSPIPLARGGNSNALIFINLSCLLTSDEDLFQVEDDDNVYRSRVVNIGEASGIVNFYASIYMCEDLFWACRDIAEPNLLPDPLKDLPRAKFKLSDNDTDEVLLEFTIDSRIELENIPLASQLTRENTFVDKLEKFFKEQDNKNIKVETWHSRNTVFRWTLGCPRRTCFSLCNLTGLPDSIAVTIESQDYSFEYPRLGVDLYKGQYTNRSSDEKSGPSPGLIPLAAGLNFGYPVDVYYPIGYKPPNFNLPLNKRFEYNAIWGVMGGIYNGTFVLNKQQDGTYKFVFDNPRDCPDSTPSEIVLDVDSTSNCSLQIRNFKSFYNWQLGKTNTRNFDTCGKIWDFENFHFEAHNCYNLAASVGCDQLINNEPFNKVFYFLGRQAFRRPVLEIQSAYDIVPTYRGSRAAWEAMNVRLFDCGLSACLWGDEELRNLASECGYHISLGGLRASGSRVSCFDKDQRQFTFPHVEKYDLDSFKSISVEYGKPFMIVKSIQTIN
jgi:hypothetical protein